MSSNSKYVNTTATLSVENRSLDGIIYSPSKPVLDSELNFLSDLSSGKLQDVVRSKVPSGWLDADYEIGFDENYETYGVNTTLEANTFYLNSKKTTPSLAVVNGWLLQVGGTDLVNEDQANKIVLNPSLNNRDDLVFLEVWKSQVSANSSSGKPDTDKLWKYGNTRYGGTNLSDEMVNSTVSFETTSRTQIQYRIRVVSDVDFISHPEGLDDFNNVFAQGGRSDNSGSVFVSAKDLLDDSGLYVSGDGSDSSRNTLNTVDGYVYAIPMMRISRRNKNSFSITNQNGSNVSVSSGVSSDRPDGLFYDQIHGLDIEDLRHAVSFDQFNYKSLLEDSFSRLLTGNLDTNLQVSELENSLKRTNIGFFVNKIASSTGGSGTNLVTQPNDQQRYYSDVAKNVLVTKKYTTSDKMTLSGTPWVPGDVVILTIKSPSPFNTVLGTMAPKVKFKHVSGSVETIRTALGIFSGLGTSNATFTLGDNSSVDLTDQNLYITYEVSYPQKGYKLTKPVTDILKVHDVVNNKDWGFVSVNDNDGSTHPYRRKVKTPLRVTLGNTDYAYTYSIQEGKHFQGVGTIVSYFMQGNGTQDYIIPGSLINPQDTEYVISAYAVDSLAPGFKNFISAVRNSGNNSIDVSLSEVVSVGKTIRFDVAVSGGVLEFDEKTQTIEDMGKVDWYEIYGNGTNTVILKNCLFSKDPDELFIGAQTELVSGVYQTACYVGDYRQFVTVTNDIDTSMVTLTFSGNVGSSEKIRICLLTNKTLVTSDNLDIYYNYKEYKGISTNPNFGTSSSSYINSVVLHQDNNLRVVTSGTGARNSSDLLPKTQDNIISILPLKDSVEGEFLGTIHTTKPIIGGSYSVDSPYSSPYVSGQKNTMTKEGVSQKRGTNKGGKFTSVSAEGETDVHKLIVSPLLEMIVDDGSNNFKPGEIALKVETNYLIDTAMNRITNSYGTEVNNSFDMFKIKGRPLIKK